MSVTGFSMQHDAEMAWFKQLERTVLASEAQRKEEQRQRCFTMGLPELEDNRSILQRLFRKTKGRNGSTVSSVIAEKPEQCAIAEEDKIVNIYDFLRTRPSEVLA